MFSSRSVCSLIVSSVVFLCGAAGAQPATTLKASVESTILTNPEIRFKHQNLMAVTSEQDAAKGGWRPRVDLESSIGTRNTVSPSLSGKEYDSSATTLQLRQTLFDGFATRSDVRRLGHTRLTSYYELLSTSDQLALEAARAYVDVLRYRELVSLARENFASHAEVHGKLESRVKAGVGRRVDLEQAAGRMALAESNWLTEASNLHDVSTRYQRLVGEVPAETLTPIPNLTRFLPAREGYVQNTVRSNPDFKGAVATIRAYRADMNLRRAPYYPTLELRASQSEEQNRNGVNGNYRDSAVQLVLNYNLYRGGADSARVKQYAAKLVSAFDLRDKVCRDVRQTALIALNDVSRLESQIVFLAQHELSTSKAREAYRQQFDIGQRSLLDLLDTENELYQARRALVNAEQDHQLSKARVLAVNGSILGALELRPIQTEAPPLPAGTEEGDDELLCSTDVPALITLDKSNLPKVDTPPPVAAPVATRAPIARSKITLAADALFDFNKADLKPEGIAKLNALVTQLQGLPMEKIVMTGHTDNKGSIEYNLDLSLARARTVALYLISKGFNKNLITAQGRGKAQPIANNNTFSGRAKNRRVDIEIVATQAK
jgi:outer membrane protein, adhesin transport system